jgi:hypothetical protein
MATKKVDFVVTEKGASKAAGGFKKVDSSMASAAKSAAKYAATYIGIRGIINLTKQAIEAFGIQEAAEKKLAVATGRNTTELVAQASALQQLTTYGDEAIISVQAMLSAFADTDEEIKALTASTLDLAAATGMDLKTAGDLVAKSYGSSTNALSRYGIEVTGAANSTERLDTLTGNIARRFEGQAAAAAETMAGSLMQASNAAGDAAEALGSLLAPEVVWVSKLLKEGAEAVIAYIDSFKYTGTILPSVYDELSRVSEEKAQAVQTLLRMEREFGRTSFEAKAAQKQLNDVTNEYTGIVNEVALTVQALQDDIGSTTVEVEALSAALDVIAVVAPTVFNELNKPETWQQMQDGMKETIDMSQILGQSLGNAFNPDMKKGDALKQFVIQFMSLMQGVILASEAVSTALTFMFTGPIGIAAAITSLAALEGAKALVRNVKFAATGAEFTTSGPQLMMVGEAGREHVSVTPLEGPNINGPQGGATFNFYGNITDKEYVRGFLIPEFVKASRLGYA